MVQIAGALVTSHDRSIALQERIYKLAGGSGARREPVELAAHDVAALGERRY
jgi:hypothetical protein